MPTRKREGSFMVKPATGWLHDDRGLQAGRGVFFTFPVQYAGSIVMESSLRALGTDAQTDVTREAIAKVAEGTASAKRADADYYPGAESYKFGRTQINDFPVKLSISAAGCLIAPIDAAEDSQEYISFHPMRLISLAAGGENNFFEYLGFVGKDPDTGVRECFVFDCMEYIEEALSTLGQAFVLAANKPKAPKRPEKVVPVAEPFAVPQDMAAQLYDVAANDGYTDIGDSAMGPLYDTAKTETGEVDDIASELMGLMKSEAQCIYDTVGPDASGSIELNPANPSGLVEKLNSTDPVALKPAKKTDGDRPTWTYFEASRTANKVDLDQMKAKYAGGESIPE
eukprot:m.337283 g.337283  ORF g.337283 m.337283 type:complete len:340 (+) comp18093_c0_seq1:130-1149(+)